MQIVLTAGPAEFREASRFGLPLAHAAYRIAEGSLLLRQNLPLQARGGLLLVEGGDVPPVTDPDALCAAALRECIRRNYSGAVLDFDGPPRQDLAALARRLGAHLESRGLGLYLPEAYGDASPEAAVLIGTAISGGNYAERLEAAAQRWGGYRRLALDTERMRMDFPLPCPTGEGTPLRAEEFQILAEGRATFFSPDLCARYFTYRQEADHHFVLYDDAATLREKLRIAAEAGIGTAFFSWPEVADLAEELFAAPLPRELRP